MSEATKLRAEEALCEIQWQRHIRAWCDVLSD